MICDKQQVMVHPKFLHITRMDLATGTSSLAIITVSACCDFFGERTVTDISTNNGPAILLALEQPPKQPD